MNDVPDYVSIFVRTPEILKDLPKGWVEIDRDGVRVLCTRTHPGFSGTILSSTLQRPVEVPIFMSRGNSNDSRVVPWTWFFRDYYGQDPRPIDSNHDWRTGATTIALVGGANQIDPNATLTAVDAGDEARHVFRVRERHPALGQLASRSHSVAASSRFRSMGFGPCLKIRMVTAVYLFVPHQPNRLCMVLIQSNPCGGIAGLIGKPHRLRKTQTGSRCSSVPSRGQLPSFLGRDSGQAIFLL